MLVLASDYVGYSALQTLIAKGISLRRLVIHRRDPGQFNARILNLHGAHLAPSRVPLSFHDELDEIVLQTSSDDRPDIGLLAWWPDIIKMPLLGLPRRGWINMHPSFLPFNRGKHPNFWCLVEGTPCGVALHVATSSVDSGDILARAELPISWMDTGETVYKRSLQLMLDMFAERIDDIVRDKIKRIRQAPSEGTFHRAAEIENASKIDLERQYRARDLLNIIRARMFRPHPTAYFLDGGKRYSVEVTIKEVGSEENG